MERKIEGREGRENKDERGGPPLYAPISSQRRDESHEATWSFNRDNGDTIIRGEKDAESLSGEEHARVGHAQDDRVEGTPAYLPPEVLGGREELDNDNAHSLVPLKTPGLASDAWALGCVASFCLLGRPLFYGTKEMVVEQQVDFLEAYYSGDSIDSQGQEGGEKGTEIGGPGKARQKGVVFAREEGPGLYMQLMQATTTTTTTTTTDSGTGTDQPPRERGRERAFLRGLLHPDPSHRYSVSEACASQFLLKGDPLLSSSAPSTTAATPIALDPLTLHHAVTPLVQLPRTPSRHQTSGGGDNEEDEQGDSGDNSNPWARRQFSVLWAPMPADYDNDDNNDGISGGGDGGRAPDGPRAGSMGGGGPRRAYTLTRLQETAAEFNTPFLS